MSKNFLLTTAILMQCGLALHLSAVEIVAHRGASFDAPENTMSSFLLGWKQQADADELDIHLSKDGRIVVNHDATTKRNFGVDKKIVDQTFAELQQLDAGGWKGDQWKGEKLPSLDQVLAAIPDGRQLFIEIKCGPSVLPPLVDLIKAANKKPEQTVIIGFDYPTVMEAKRLLPELKVLWLASPDKDSKGLLPTAEDLVSKATAAGLDGLDLSSGFALDQQFVSKVKQAGLQLHVWTVDSTELGKKLVDLGIDGITTNRPALMREQLKGRGTPPLKTAAQ